jgi:uncharacterized membrane protein
MDRMSEFDRGSGIVPGAPIQSGDEAARSAPLSPGPLTPAPSHHGMMSRIRNYFLTGLVLVGPLYITANLTWWFINWVDDLVRPLIPVPYRPETYLPVHVPGTGLIIAFLALTVLGFLTANLVGRTLVEFGENILNRMPVVRPIYKSLKQIFETLFSNSGSSFRRVGLVEFPGPGMWSLVFLSQPPGANIAARLPEAEHISAFMPCTLLLLRAASRGDRSRYHGGDRNDAADVGRDGAVGRGRCAEKARRLGRHRPWALLAAAPQRRAGEVSCAGAQPARIRRTASSRSNR